jgi:hypothetical protein
LARFVSKWCAHPARSEVRERRAAIARARLSFSGYYFAL